MAFLRCDFFSESLSLSTSMTVILPQATSTQIGMDGVSQDAPPVLYLLHGLTDDDTIWTRRTSIERYAAPLGLAVVMPQVHQSFYADDRSGLRFWTFLSEELPTIVDSFFRVSTHREDTFVAGLSMGGYGAMKWALRQPERFAAAASLSGALDLGHVQDAGDPWVNAILDRVFAGSISGTPDDTVHLVQEVDPAQCPALYVGCGTEDDLYPASLAFVDAARRSTVPVTSAFSPGEHEWGYWDRTIQDVLAWLPLRGR
ncbi:MAG: esterase family protein [Actinomycetales bacterium]|nr:esterase family protein [Actinomycetales bacterium]